MYHFFRQLNALADRSWVASRSRLERAGYHVRWTTIPAEVTPMNRVLIGRRQVRLTTSGEAP